MVCKIYSYFIQLTISTEAFPACNYKKFKRQYYLFSCTPHELQFITLHEIAGLLFVTDIIKGSSIARNTKIVRGKQTELTHIKNVFWDEISAWRC